MKQLIRAGDWIAARSEASVLTTAVSTIVFFGVVDYALGDLAFSIVYLLPLIAVGWRLAGRHRLVVSICGLAAGTWVAADLATRQAPLHPVVIVWNGASRFGIFFLVVTLLQALRGSLRDQQELARRDPLTGVANNRAFRDEMERSLLRCHENRRPITLVYIDLDDFKAINSTLGHSGGDEVLRTIAIALAASTRSTDVVGRLGGDEFGILLPGAGSEATKQVLDGLLERTWGALSEIRLERSVTFSAGAVTFLISPQDIDEMIDAADTLMYAVKREGKANYRHRTIGEGAPDAVPDAHAPRPVLTSLSPSA